jgi:hypothetical protein
LTVSERPAGCVCSRHIGSNLKGRLAQASWATGQVAFGYDEQDHVNSRVFGDPDGNVTGIEQHTYHTDGSEQALDLRLPDTAFVDEHVAYTYDSAGRERSASYFDGTSTENLFSATTLDAFGRIREAQYGASKYTASYADTGRREPSPFSWTLFIPLPS